MTILDFGNGGTCHNDKATVTNMITGLAFVDPNRQSVIKWQLWDRGTEPQCTRLDWEMFNYAFEEADKRGFRTTASVFDKPSLDYLLTYDIPFVKLANRPYLRHLARYVPRGIPLFISYSNDYKGGEYIPESYWLACVSRYPAEEKSYLEFEDHCLEDGISDHTVGLDLWRKYHPTVWEKHYKLPTSTGPDAGPWCVTPDDLKEVFT